MTSAEFLYLMKCRPIRKQAQFIFETDSESLRSDFGKSNYGSVQQAFLYYLLI